MKQKSIEGEKYMEKKENSEFKIAIVGLTLECRWQSHFRNNFQLSVLM